MRQVSSRPGYVFLLAVLGVGIVVMSISLSLMLLGWAAEQNGVTLERAAQAYGNAQACAEQALLSLRMDSGYAGSEQVTFAQGTCAIAPVCVTGDDDRIVQVTGVSGESTRRLEIDIAQLLPETQVRSWTEVTSFTPCP